MRVLKMMNNVRISNMLKASALVRSLDFLELRLLLKEVGIGIFDGSSQ